MTNLNELKQNSVNQKYLQLPEIHVNGQIETEIQFSELGIARRVPKKIIADMEGLRKVLQPANPNQIAAINGVNKKMIIDLKNQAILNVEKNQDVVESHNLLKEINDKKKFKKNRRQKTKFKILKTNKNVTQLKNIISDYISKNSKLVNQQNEFCKEYEEKAPFQIETLDFARELIEDEQLILNNYGFDSKNLKKNHLILEQLMLTRLTKRHIKLNKDKISDNSLQNQTSKDQRKIQNSFTSANSQLKPSKKVIDLEKQQISYDKMYIQGNIVKKQEVIIKQKQIIREKSLFRSQNQ